jgi:uncharacterized protein
MKTRLNYIFALLLTTSFIQAQISQEELDEALISRTTIIARAYQDSVVLRWGVDKPAIWEIACHTGYRIERAEMTDTTIAYDKLIYREIKGSPFISWVEQQYAAYFATHDESQPESEEMYLVSLLTGAFDQETDQPPQAFSAFQDNLNSLREGKNIMDNKFGFSMLLSDRSRNAAIALGVRTTDYDVEKGKTYVYKISLPDYHGVYLGSEDYVKVNTSKDFNPGQYKRNVYFKENDGEIILVWNSSAEFSTFWVERSGSRDGQYLRLTETPLLNSKPAGYEGDERTGYSDKGLINYTRYYYRIFGNTAFADQVLIGEIEAMPRDRTAPLAPFLEMPVNSRPGEVSLKWKMNAMQESDLKGFIVARAENASGPFIRINNELLDPESREYTDTSYLSGRNNFYLIQVYDTAFNFSTSNISLVCMVDSIPPAAPKLLTGAIDSLGIVTLTIAENEENDLMGYRIYRANSPEHEFSVIQESFISVDSINQKVKTVFVDTVTLNSLTPNIYYKIKALDLHYNSSPFSELIVIKRPDTVPPITPVFKKVLVKEDAIELHFAPSESEDVIRQILYRKTSMDAPWDSLVVLGVKKRDFIDSNVVKGTTYYYSIRARDNSNLLSGYAMPVCGKPYDNGERLAVDQIIITRSDHGVVLKWEYLNENEKTFYVIYKKDKKGILKQYDRAEGLIYEDIAADKGIQSYAIKVFTNDGGQSVMSKPADIIIE